MILSTGERELLQHYFSGRPIRRAYLFGSYARGTANSVDSDLDILVELDYSKPIGMKFFTFALELEKLLNKRVDLVSAEGLSPHVRPFVDKDKVLIYEKGAD